MYITNNVLRLLISFVFVQLYKGDLKSRSLEYKKLEQLYIQTKEELESLKTIWSRASSTIRSFIKVWKPTVYINLHLTLCPPSFLSLSPSKEPHDISNSDLLPVLFELLLKSPVPQHSSSTSLIGRLE